MHGRLCRRGKLHARRRRPEPSMDAVSSRKSFPMPTRVIGSPHRFPWGPVQAGGALQGDLGDADFSCSSGHRCHCHPGRSGSPAKVLISPARAPAADSGSMADPPRESGRGSSASSTSISLRWADCWNLVTARHPLIPFGLHHTPVGGRGRRALVSRNFESGRVLQALWAPSVHASRRRPSV